MVEKKYPYFLKRQEIKKNTNEMPDTLKSYPEIIDEIVLVDESAKNGILMLDDPIELVKEDEEKVEKVEKVEKSLDNIELM